MSGTAWRWGLLSALALAACVNFEDEFQKHGATLPSRLDDAGVALDGGTDGGVDAGAEVDGGTDAGTDAGVDAGFCSTLGCFAPVVSMPTAWGAWAALFDQPDGTLFVGNQSQDQSYGATAQNGVVTELGQLEVNGTALTSIWAAVPLSTGEFFTVGGELAFHSPSGDQLTTTCGQASVTGWHQGVAASDDEAWFARDGAGVCHWTRAGGFEFSPLSGFSTSARLSSITLAPDGGLWLVDYNEELLYEQDGTSVDAGDGVYLKAVRRIGASVYGWHPNSGLFVFDDDATGWQRLRSEGVSDVWGEPGNVWVLASTLSAGKPVLIHSEADGGWTRHPGAALFPPDFPATANFFTITGKGSRVVLMGPDENVGAWAVEFRR